MASDQLQRAVRLQQSIQKSRQIAWVLFVALTVVSLFCVLALIAQFQRPAGVFTIGAGITAVVAILAAGIAVQMLLAGRRLGRLLKDPELLMRSRKGSDDAKGLHWSALLPWSGRRD
jgi:NhaP-type Na+/H+ or K+/H+ antiporter